MLAELLVNKTALMIGCGLSCNDDTSASVRHLLEKTVVPTVLDADGLNVFSAHIVDLKAVKAGRRKEVKQCYSFRVTKAYVCICVHASMCVHVFAGQRN